MHISNVPAASEEVQQRGTDDFFADCYGMQVRGVAGDGQAPSVAANLGREQLLEPRPAHSDAPVACRQARPARPFRMQLTSEENLTLRESMAHQKILFQPLILQTKDP